jgi:hypothetical protein
MARKPQPPRLPRADQAVEQADQAAEQADYAAWKLAAVANLTNRHDLKPGTIPERLWRHMYIQGRSPQKAADQAAASAYNTQSAADRLRGRKR